YEGPHDLAGGFTQTRVQRASDSTDFGAGQQVAHQQHAHEQGIERQSEADGRPHLPAPESTSPSSMNDERDNQQVESASNVSGVRGGNRCGTGPQRQRRTHLWLVVPSGQQQYSR